jgi:hypothetical protein
MEETLKVAPDKLDESNLPKELAELSTYIEDFKKNVLTGESLHGATIEISTVERGPCLKTRQNPMFGTLVAVRLAKSDKTFLGIYLGDLTIDVHAMYHKVKKTLTLQPVTNPAIFVPEIDRLVWGCESWWKPLKSAEDLKEITDADIESVWYVRALKELASKDKADNSES